MKNQLVRLLVLVCLVGFADTGTAWGEEPPAGIKALVVMDVDGNGRWSPGTPDDVFEYTPGYDMDDTSRISIGGTDVSPVITPQVFALIVYIPAVMPGGTVDFSIRGHRTSKIHGVAGNMVLDQDFDFKLVPTRATTRGIPAVRAVAFGNDPDYGAECAVVYVHCRDYGGRTSIAIHFNNVRLQDGALVPDPPPYSIPLRFRSRTAFPWWQGRYGPDENDVDESTLYAANVKGDRLTVFEEYRGLFINGVHRRLTAAQSYDGRSTGGPDIKDGFFVDDTGRIPTDAANTMSVLGVSWHVIRHDEMDPNAIRRGDQAGFVNFNKEHGTQTRFYRCILFIRDDNIDTLAYSGSLRISSRRPVRVNVQQVEDDQSNFALTDAEVFLVFGWIAGHETGHKVGLDHRFHSRDLAPGPVTPDATGSVDDTVYWVLPATDPDVAALRVVAPDTPIGMWVPASSRDETIDDDGDGTTDRTLTHFCGLESPEAEVGGSLLRSGGTASVSRHGDPHMAVIKKCGLRGAPMANIQVYSHTGTLSDHLIDVYDPQDTLDPADGPMIDVTR